MTFAQHSVLIAVLTLCHACFEKGGSSGPAVASKGPVKQSCETLELSNRDLPAPLGVEALALAEVAFGEELVANSNQVKVTTLRAVKNKKEVAPSADADIYLFTACNLDSANESCLKGHSRSPIWWHPDLGSLGALNVSAQACVFAARRRDSAKLYQTIKLAEGPEVYCGKEAQGFGRALKTPFAVKEVLNKIARNDAQFFATAVELHKKVLGSRESESSKNDDSPSSLAEIKLEEHLQQRVVYAGPYAVAATLRDYPEVYELEKEHIKESISNGSRNSKLRYVDQGLGLNELSDQAVELCTEEKNGDDESDKLPDETCLNGSQEACQCISKCDVADNVESCDPIANPSCEWPETCGLPAQCIASEKNDKCVCASLCSPEENTDCVCRKVCPLDDNGEVNTECMAEMDKLEKRIFPECDDLNDPYCLCWIPSEGSNVPSFDQNGVVKGGIALAVLGSLLVLGAFYGLYHSSFQSNKDGEKITTEKEFDYAEMRRTLQNEIPRMSENHIKLVAELVDVRVEDKIPVDEDVLADEKYEEMKKNLVQEKGKYIVPFRYLALDEQRFVVFSKFEAIDSLSDEALRGTMEHLDKDLSQFEIEQSTGADNASADGKNYGSKFPVKSAVAGTVGAIAIVFGALLATQTLGLSHREGSIFSRTKEITDRFDGLIKERRALRAELARVAEAYSVAPN